MHIGVSVITLEIHSSRSLKDKRRIVKSISERIKSNFNASVAEVDNNNSWDKATLAVVCVSNNQKYTNELLTKITNYVLQDKSPVNVLDFSTEIISGNN